MLVARFAQHLLLLLSRILRLALPAAPFGPYPASLPPRDPPSGPNKHPSNHPRPARRPSAFTPLPSPLYPSSPTTDTPENPPKHAPRRLKSFLEKTLIARETPTQHPANTLGAPAPSADPMPHAQATRHPIPIAPPGPPTLPLSPPSARSFSASKARISAPKSAQTVSRQPAPSRGRLARDGSPLHPHASAAHANPAAPCTLSSRSSTVTPESRS